MLTLYQALPAGAAAATGAAAAAACSSRSMQQRAAASSKLQKQQAAASTNNSRSATTQPQRGDIGLIFFVVLFVRDQAGQQIKEGSQSSSFASSRRPTYTAPCQKLDANRLGILSFSYFHKTTEARSAVSAPHQWPRLSGQQGVVAGKIRTMAARVRALAAAAGASSSTKQHFTFLQDHQYRVQSTSPRS